MTRNNLTARRNEQSKTVREQLAVNIPFYRKLLNAAYIGHFFEKMLTCAAFVADQQKLRRIASGTLYIERLRCRADHTADRQDE